MSLEQQVMDSMLASVRAALCRQPSIALTILDGMIKSSLRKIDANFPYGAACFLRFSAYWNLQELADIAARRAKEFGLEDEARVYKQRILVYGELRAAEIALHNEENSKAAVSVYIAEALAPSAGLKINFSFQQLEEFYFLARHL